MPPVNSYQTILPAEWNKAIALSRLEERPHKNNRLIFRKRALTPYSGWATAIWKCCQGSKESHLILIKDGKINRWTKFRYGVDSDYDYSGPLQLEFDVFLSSTLSDIHADAEILDMLGDKRISSISTGEAASPLGPRYINYKSRGFSLTEIDCTGKFYFETKKPHGLSLTLYETGRPALLTKCQGERLIEAVAWRPDGFQIATNVVKGTGLLIEPHLNPRQDGKGCEVENESNWLNGLKHGRYVAWSYGKKSTEGTYAKGKKQGTWREWHGNGQLCSETHFLNDKQNGLFKYWDYDGELKNTESYKSGILIEQGKYP